MPAILGRSRLSRRIGAAIVCFKAFAAVIVSIALLGCAGGRHGQIVATVAGVPITGGTVEHWSAVFAGAGKRMPSSRRRALREQALEFLISARWLALEASARRMSASGGDVRRRLEQRQLAEFPGGREEYMAFVAATGRTEADVAEEARAEVEAANLEQIPVRRLRPVLRAQVIDYYRRHLASFAIPERREVAITNAKTASAARAIVRAVAAERRFPPGTKYELLARPPLGRAQGRTSALAAAIFSASPRALVGPVRVRVDYYVLEVRRVLARAHRPFAQVEGAVAKRLEAGARQRALTAFAKAWSRHWRAQTTCAAGYVVPQCLEFSAPGGAPGAPSPQTLISSGKASPSGSL